MTDLPDLDVCRYGCRYPSRPLRVAAVVKVPGGCVCFPHDRQQALWLQHLYRAEPLASLDVVWLAPGLQWP